jgi:opacity protein-like surface antigen
VTGLVLGTQPRDRWFYTLGASRLLSEITSVGLQFSQSEEEYKDPRFSDSRGYTGSIFFARDLGDLYPLLKGRANFGYGRYSYDFSETEGYRWTLGAEGPLNEKWSFIVDLGVSRNRSKFKVVTLRPVVFFPFVFQVPVTEEKTNTTWAGVGELSLNFRDDSTGGGITLQQDITPASGQGPVWSTSLRTYLDRRFTYELKGLLTAEYFYTRAQGGEFSARETKNHTVNISAGLQCEFSEEMKLEASYTYSRIMDQVADTTAGRSLFLIRFFIQQELLELLR